MLRTVNKGMGERMYEAKLRACRCVRAIAAVAALVAGAGVADATLKTSSAAAGAWMQPTCVNPDQSAAPNDGWSSFAAGAVSIGSTNDTNCAPGHPMYAFLSTQSPAGAGASENLRYTPPRGSTLIGGSLSVGLSADGYGHRAVATAALLTPAFSYDAANVFLQCVAVLAACQNATPDFYGAVELPANKGGSLFLSAGCAGQTPDMYCSSGGSHNAWSLVALFSANLLLANSSQPTATDFNGSLLEPGAHGSATLAFTAADPDGPGVYKVTVTIDDKTFYSATPNTNAGKCVPVATDTASGALMFDSQQPCPSSEPVNLDLAISRLADGPHALRVSVMDGAQNTSTVLAQTITTNNRTTVSANLTGDRRANANGAPLYAIALDAPTQALARGVRRDWPRSALTLSGTLRNSAGVPAPGVAVTLLTQDGGQQGAQMLSRATTDATGHWVLSAPRGPSRLLTITPGVQVALAPAPGVVTIAQTVTPTLSLRVQARGRGRLRFSGRLRITPLGTPRPLVVIQARNAKGWQTVGASPLRVSASGAYSLNYDGGRRSIGGHYSFRALAPSTRLFSTATSPIRKTVVR
jgi:hypothetical protein